ncbi:MAG: ABC-2 transporter permease [bacterium]|nr:ABC-2 transporter permease [bacterium]
MKAFKFCKIDLLRSRAVIALTTLIMIVFATYFIVDEEGLGFVAGYLAVITVVISILPFNLEQRYESGFIDMLPGTISQRVYGRYLYAFLIMVLCSLLGVASMILFTCLGNKVEGYFGAIYLGMVSIVLFVVTIEYIIFYAVGKTKTQKVLPILQIMLPMLIFLGSARLGEYLESNANIDITWLVDNKYMVSVAAFFVSVLIFLASIKISTQICKRRDYA